MRNRNRPVARKIVQLHSPGNQRENASADSCDGSSGAPSSKRENQADALVRLALKSAIYFHHGEEAYAQINAGDHLETILLRSSAFRIWLAGIFYKKQQKPANREAIGNSIETLAARAIYDGQEHDIFTRVAQHDGKIYIDLGDPSWCAVEVSQLTWRVISSRECPVRFRRAKGTAALPMPAEGGSIADMRAFLNLGSDDDFFLITAWLVAAARPTGPYPILIVHGEKGACKSSMVRILRDLIDPSDAPLRSAPREERDLAIAAKNGWVITGENLSHLSAELSDSLCRLSTGAGLTTRKLYTDDEETIFLASRPIVLNAISEIATRPDLLDRAIVISLPAMQDGNRKAEDDLRREFAQARPQLFGALLDAVVVALGNIDTVKVDNMPRMADFSKWITAAESALPWATGDFLRAYRANRMSANELAVEASSVAEAVRALARPWSGTATELLAALNSQLGDKRPPKNWPDAPRALTNRLRNIAPDMRAMGIDVQLPDGRNHDRTIYIDDVSQPGRSARAGA